MRDGAWFSMGWRSAAEVAVVMNVLVGGYAHRERQTHSHWLLAAMGLKPHPAVCSTTLPGQAGWWNAEAFALDVRRILPVGPGDDKLTALELASPLAHPLRCPVHPPIAHDIRRS